MNARLTSDVLVSAMIRQAEAAGGHAMVLARGDATAGAILAVIADRGRTTALMERTLGAGGYGVVRTGPDDAGDPGAVADYVARRRRRDPDLWVVELDTPHAGTIAQDVMG